MTVFISIEGNEGAGKTTQILLLKQFLDQKKIANIITREPGGTSLGEKLREIILYHPINAYSELLLILASRYQHLLEVILPALNAKKWVISDRYSDSTYAYQGMGRGIGINTINQIEQKLPQYHQPDLRIILLSSQKISNQRLQKKQKDRIENESDEFFTKINQYYQELNENNVIKIDANQSIKNVFNQIKQAISRFLPNG